MNDPFTETYRNLYTTVELPADLPRITHRHRLMLLGSCFASHIGRRLSEAKFRCDVNPYGVLYNPLSLAAALRRIAAGRHYAVEDLFWFNGCWHSSLHHGDFSAASAEEALERINGRQMQATDTLRHLDFLLLTLGTAWVYEDRETGCIVGNCHKRPERCFLRRRLSVGEVVDEYTSLLGELLALRPGLKVLFTVSPIRHVRDGLHANQLSKSTLLLAIDELQARFPDTVCYFPAYELLQDELRDYRFYAEDMVHPSTVAVRYVWERFARVCFSEETRQVMAEVAEVARMLEHRPFRPESEEYKRFLGQIVLKISRLNEKYPYLDFDLEREVCRTRLNR